MYVWKGKPETFPLKTEWLKKGAMTLENDRQVWTKLSLMLSCSWDTKYLTPDSSSGNFECPLHFIWFLLMNSKITINLSAVAIDLAIQASQ